MSAGNPSAAISCPVSRRVRRDESSSCDSASRGNRTALGEGAGGTLEERVVLEDRDGLALQRYTVEVEAVEVAVALDLGS